MQYEPGFFLEHLYLDNTERLTKNEGLRKRNRPIQNPTSEFVMRYSVLNKYRVDEVPAGIKPVFYFYSYVIAVIFFIYALTVHLTSRIQIFGMNHIDPHRNYIFCHWHTYSPFHLAVFFYKKSQVWIQHPFWFMKAVHLFLRFTGVKKIIFGSTGHFGRQAADELVRYLKKGYSTVLLPDGPSGPAFIAKKGMLHISLQSQVPIAPLRYSASKCFESKGWDQRKWPIPFSKITVHIGEPFQVSEANFDEAYTKIIDNLG